MDNLLFPLMIVLLGGFVYMNSRAKKKRMAAIQEMHSASTTGARVQLTCGLYGTVIDSNNDMVDVEIAPGVVTRWNKLAIREVVATEDAAATYPGAALLDDDADLDADTADDAATTENTSPVDGPSLIKDDAPDAAADKSADEK